MGCVGDRCMDGCVDVMYITVSGNLRTLEPGGIIVIWVGTKEGRVLFNDTLNTFYLRLYVLWTYGKGPFRQQERQPAATTWATLSEIAARVLLYAPSHRQDSTYHGHHMSYS